MTEYSLHAPMRILLIQSSYKEEDASWEEAKIQFQNGQTDGYALVAGREISILSGFIACIKVRTVLIKSPLSMDNFFIH